MSSPAPAQAYCSSCGFLCVLGRCEVCGATGEPLHLGDGRRRELRAEVDPQESAGLERAVEAHRSRDITRFVAHVVAAEGGGTVSSITAQDGPGWVATIRSGTVFVALQGSQLVLLAPIVRLPQKQRVPAMRLALELCAGSAATARFCLRDDVLLLRFTTLAANLTPLALRGLLRELGELAARYEEVFGIAFDAPPVLTDAQRDMPSFDALGRPRRLRLPSEVHRMPTRSAEPTVTRVGEPTSTRAPEVPAPRPSERSLPVASAEPLPRREAERTVPFSRSSTSRAVLTSPRSRVEPTQVGLQPLSVPGGPGPATPPVASTLTSGTSPALRGADFGQPPHSRSESSGGLPSVGLHAPPPASSRPAMRRDDDPPPTTRAAPTPGRSSGEELPPILSPGLASRPRAASSTSSTRLPPVEVAPPPATMETAPAQQTVVARKPSGGRYASVVEAEPGGRATTSRTLTLGDATPADRFVSLLRGGEALLGTALGLGGAAVALTVRAIAFRAVAEHRDTLPDGVAHLYRHATSPREGAEPTAALLARLVAARGAMPGERPLVVEPFATASQAKEHVARAIAELERMPTESPLRHFIAVGTLTEVLVRAKLPAQTEQRLQDIIRHTLREGPKPAAMELLMTALYRIAAA